MSEAVHNPQQEFWRPPVRREPATEIPIAPGIPALAESCPHCQSEFMIGARFCHACGALRPSHAPSSEPARSTARELLEQKLAILQSFALNLSKRSYSAPSWMRYLHFHEIKRSIGLPTPSLIAFMIGIGCVLGALGVSLFYKASTMAEFQAIQMWRIEWLLASTASFVAGILLKRPSARD